MEPFGNFQSGRKDNEVIDECYLCLNKKFSFTVRQRRWFPRDLREVVDVLKIPPDDDPDFVKGNVELFKKYTKYPHGCISQFHAHAVLTFVNHVLYANCFFYGQRNHRDLSCLRYEKKILQQFSKDFFEYFLDFCFKIDVWENRVQCLKMGMMRNLCMKNEVFPFWYKVEFCIDGYNPDKLKSIIELAFNKTNQLNTEELIGYVSIQHYIGYNHIFLKANKACVGKINDFECIHKAISYMRCKRKGLAKPGQIRINIESFDWNLRQQVLGMTPNSILDPKLTLKGFWLNGNQLEHPQEWIYDKKNHYKEIDPYEGRKFVGESARQW